MFNFFKRQKSSAGKVYVGEVKYKNGKSKLYTGQTKRSVFQRVGEHMKGQRSSSKSTYTSKGSSFKLIGSVYSKNRYKAEKSIKKLTPSGKRWVAKKGANNWNKRYKKW